MGYNTDETAWPAVSIPNTIKSLIDTFFSILDDSSDSAGPRLADEIFTSDGVLNGPAGSATGHTEISKCREHAWVVVKKRRHTIERVYVHDANAQDLLLVGRVQMTLVNQRLVSGDFTARILLSTNENGEARIKNYQVWADSAPITKGLEETREGK